MPAPARSSFYDVDAELSALDFGSWHASGADTDAPDRENGTSSVLTLERLLEFVADCGRPVPLAIETKHPTRYARLVERRLVDLLERFGHTSAAQGLHVRLGHWHASIPREMLRMRE